MEATPNAPTPPASPAAARDDSSLYVWAEQLAATLPPLSAEGVAAVGRIAATLDAQRKAPAGHRAA